MHKMLVGSIFLLSSFASSLVALHPDPENDFEQLARIFNVRHITFITHEVPIEDYNNDTPLPNPQQSHSKKPTPPLAPAAIPVSTPKDKVLFKDIAGQEKAVEHLLQVVNQYKNPERLRAFGGKPKKGILLEGPSGTGKTMLAQALANELGFHFINLSASSMVQLYVGQGAKHVREAFAKARKKAPSVIFFDEIDAIGAADRGSSGSGGDQEYRQTLTEFLCQMNELRDDEKVIVVAATNTVTVLDEAFKSPHRFEVISVPLPTQLEREAIFNLYLTRLPKKNIEGDIARELATLTKGFSGAKIEALIQNAIQYAVADVTAPGVTNEHLLKAVEKERQAHKASIFGTHKKEFDALGFSDIAGLSKVIKEFEELVFALKHPEELKKFGASIPRGYLLIGKPGCGKTMIARALANEAGCTFLEASASSLDGKFIGEGAKRIRELFEQARAVSPTIIFLDEIDGIATQQTLNELLTQMDGFTANDNIIVIGATNHPRLIPESLKRPGRFTKIIEIPLPDKRARAEILALYLSKLPRVAREDIDLDALVEKTEGFNSATLKELINEAATIACRAQADMVRVEDIEEALENISSAHKYRA